MGIFDRFKRRQYDEYDDEDEYDEGQGESTSASVTLEGQLELKICKPKTFEQLLVAIDYLSQGRTVLLNLEGVDKTMYRRMIDFISGAAYALHVNIKKATNDSYFIAPKDVDVSGELFEEKETGDDEEFSDI